MVVEACFTLKFLLTKILWQFSGRSDFNGYIKSKRECADLVELG